MEVLAAPNLNSLGTAGYALIITTLLVWWLVSAIRQYHRLRHIPGPPLAPFSKLWLFRKASSGRTHLDYYDACNKYGPIVRVGPNDVLTNDPNLMKMIWAVRSDYTKSQWYRGVKLNGCTDNLVSEMDEQKHHALRSKVAIGYSGKEVESMESKVDRQILAFINLLETRYVSQNKAFDFAHKSMYLTLDVLSDVAFSQPFGFIKTDSDMFNYIETLGQNIPFVFPLNAFPWVVGLLQSPLLKVFMPSDKDRTGLGPVINIANHVAAQRFGPDKQVHRDMLGSFVKHGVTLEEAESESLLQIIAGSDTTAGAIRIGMLYALTQPRVVDSLRHEIASRKLSWPVISDAEARDMPYLQAFIKEGLRIQPPSAGTLMPRVVGPQGDTWKGVYFPPGTEIGVCQVGFMRRPDIWGDDAEVFRPERWLEASADKLREMDAAVDLAFGSGRWSCLGRNLASMELNKVFVELFRRFDFVIMNPENPWKSTNAGIFLTSDFWLKAYPRST
ncbi:pisatin demethylase [Podospora appendiculata]|uniref:Pisatin demethylase n=1 Tax=Podospora appendiculata TaxID=314037 RepID=A0AAE0XBT1_9PEZI|nr:pisatin demethylase [Podospora appendiculata]